MEARRCERRNQFLDVQNELNQRFALAVDVLRSRIVHGSNDTLAQQRTELQKKNSCARKWPDSGRLFAM